MNVTQREYAEMTKQASPNSSVLKDCLMAFLFGGAICTLGQALFTLYQQTGLDEKSARGAVSISLILIAAVLTALNIFDNIAKYAGAGTLVPITGFANAMVAPAIEFKTEGFVLGVGAKMFAIAGPVLVYGISASVVYGIILYAISLF